MGHDEGPKAKTNLDGPNGQPDAGGRIASSVHQL